jgi:hypothetical protein
LIVGRRRVDVRLSVHFVTVTLRSELPAVVVPIEEYWQLREAMREQQGTRSSTLAGPATCPS